MRHERLVAVLDLVQQTGHVTVAEVTARLRVSPATARRDLNTLAEQRLVLRTHGGASTATAGRGVLPGPASPRRPAPATAAARAVVRLVRPGDVVGLDGGPGTTEVARRLARADHLYLPGAGRALTVVTSAVDIAYELAVRPHVRVVLTGGEVAADGYGLVGPVAARSLADLVLDLTVLGADGVSPRFGVTAANPGRAEVGRVLAGAAKRVLAVADARALAAAAGSRLLDLAELDVLVTDGEPDDELLHALSSAGADLVRTGDLRSADAVRTVDRGGRGR
ncbi:DeoR/GlpR family DNA-binding transcription regulator [Jannaschia sp. R86511]|uniref:DeoR/GlpR family DNA-binding transcription regulator n=1 Tax=Jannaschia sp. R86511 TaxID=3093853 RepID=UPI0036D333A9